MAKAARTGRACGSSPRLWGTPAVLRREGSRPRFIPTPVGNTGEGMTINAMTAVHPHACGEHIHLWILTTMDCGSSPRLWGTQYQRCSPQHSTRFIPTPVGNTPAVVHVDNKFTVHPHACGEHKLLLRCVDGSNGSSPRLWGTPRYPEAHPGGCRFIPTPVGNTNYSPYPDMTNPVHPHACGEHPWNASRPWS